MGSVMKELADRLSLGRGTNILNMIQGCPTLCIITEHSINGLLWHEHVTQFPYQSPHM